MKSGTETYYNYKGFGLNIIIIITEMISGTDVAPIVT